MTPLRWLAVLLLAGCAAVPSPDAPRACEVRKAADIPVSFDHGAISVPASIDDKPVTLMVDTGSEASLVTPSAMAALRLQTDRRRRTTIRTAGGAITTQNALLRSFAIGGLEMLNRSVAVGPLPGAPGAALQGLLGADWLTDFDVELDLPNRRIGLYRAAGCGPDHAPWPGPTVSLPARIVGRGLVVLSAELDGQPVSALLDSGANASILSSAAAARIGVAAAALAQDPSGQSVGIDGSAMPAHRHRFERFRIGTATYANPVVSVASMHTVLADLLLGLDWLRGNRVWISYAAHRVTLQPVGAPLAE